MMTRARKPISRWLAATLAMCLAGGLLALPAHAVEYVDTSAKGTLTIRMPTNNDPESVDAVYRADLAANGSTDGEDGKVYGENGVTIPVQLVKIAGINAGGSYETSGLGPDIDKALMDFAANNTADAWRTATIKIMEALYDKANLDYAEPAEDEKAGDVIPTLKVNAKLKASTGKTLASVMPGETGKPLLLTKENDYSATAEGLEVGLYLAAPEAVDSHYYHYTFTPALLSVPMTEFLLPEGQYVGDTDAEWEDPAEDWTYSYTADLKPMRENRKGQLAIRKAISTFNATLGETTFVFKVHYKYEHRLAGEPDWDEEEVYGLTFEELATKGFVIKDLPVGAKVTVTEIYSGASYEVKVGQGDNEIVIPALDESLQDYLAYNHIDPTEQLKYDKVDGETTAWVYFENDYQPDRFNPNLGIVNRWIRTDDGHWRTDNTADNEGDNNVPPARADSSTAGSNTQG